MRTEKILQAVAVVLLCASATYGGPPPPKELPLAPPDMGAIAWPIGVASIVAAVVVAGGLLLLRYFGPWAGFSLVKKLFRRMRGVV